MEYRLQTKGEGGSGVVGKQEEKGDGDVEENRQQQGEETSQRHYKERDLSEAKVTMKPHRKRGGEHFPE